MINYEYLVHEKFKLIMKKAGLQNALERGITFHSLRHTFACNFMQSGGNIYDLQLLLGHSTVTTTEVYLHFKPDYLSGATDIVYSRREFPELQKGLQENLKTPQQLSPKRPI